MKLAREETKINVTGRRFYRKNNLKFEGRNRSRNRNRGQKIWDPEPEPEPEPRQNGTVTQHWAEGLFSTTVSAMLVCSSCGSRLAVMKLFQMRPVRFSLKI
jgi:hypothetical protein